MKTVATPMGDVVHTGDLLYNWLGLFWQRIFKDQSLINSYTDAQGLLGIQLYLDFLETFNLLDRENLPVYHRERWRALILNLSERDTGQAVYLKIGGTYTAKIGPQDEDPFVEGAVPEIDGYAALKGVTAFPLAGADIAETSAVIVDNIAAPNTALLRGHDFIIQDNTILFLNGYDPFDEDFPIRETAGGDRQIVLWVSDVLIDKELVYKHMGYIVGIEDRTSEFYKNYLNALWDLYNRGASIALFKSGLAAMLGEPFVIEDEETIEEILELDDKIQIITDAHVYELPPTAELRTGIAEGALIQHGDLLSKTVQVFEHLDPNRLAVEGQQDSEIRAAIPALFLPPALFRTELRYGLGITWELSRLIHCGTDANGNAKLKFTIYGSQDDVDAFWEDFWNYCEQHNIASETCFSDYLDGIVVPQEGSVYGHVSPMEYFLDQYMKSNLLVVVVDVTKLSARARQTMGLLGTLRKVIPAHVCMVVMEQQLVGTETYDMGENTEEVFDILARIVSDSAGQGPPTVDMVYRDSSRARWIPVCQE